MADKNDQIFQLSLTEIAFILVFILMFLLGSMVAWGHQENQRLLERLRSYVGIEQKQADLKKAEQFLEDKLVSKNIDNPQEVIKNLVDSVRSQNEIIRLKKQLVDQEAKITALSELQKAIDEAAKGQGDGALVQQRIEQALALTKTIKEQLQEKLEKTDEKALSEDPDYIAKAAKQQLADKAKIDQTFTNDPLLAALAGDSPGQKLESLIKEYREVAVLKKEGADPVMVRKENTDLKGQIQFLKNKLEAKGGLDYPPCWADEQGKIQYLFSVELHEHELNVARAWPDTREADAHALPNIQSVMAAASSDYPRFLDAVKPISDLSRKLNCRHYVRIKNLIPDAVTSDRRRLSIEDYFYKVEVRR
ncbi:hypothetical protein thsps21_18240 [Pseudomonas sp. No.21]|uniref:hypothetical protein n=1 Tax=Pseudomonas sp. TUM22785 TaxID=3019098 RepID=UPI002306B120|nr:hypothetical protein [Pseudomonas sp. TUM22785]WCD78559.1 hypothetical protein PI990_21470 [Pseudomonas sp. TUM22785]